MRTLRFTAAGTLLLLALCASAAAITQECETFLNSWRLGGSCDLAFSMDPPECSSKCKQDLQVLELLDTPLDCDPYILSLARMVDLSMQE
jgi:hypothetical protein